MPSAPRILLVDDDPAVRLVLKRIFSRAGFAIHEARDGIEALERHKSVRPAAILLDVDMPRMNGWAVLEELRARDSATPIIMLTQEDTVPARVKGLEAGADDYVGKPCDLTELLARVKAVIRRSGRPPGTSRLRFGNVVVDLERKSVQRGAETVSLTRTEFAMLELLARQRGRPVSRETMLREIWGMSDSSNSHAVDTAIWRLRKKLGDSGADPRWIQNLSGIGHVLHCEPDAKTDSYDGASGERRGSL